MRRTPIRDRWEVYYEYKFGHKTSKEEYEQNIQEHKNARTWDKKSLLTIDKYLDILLYSKKDSSYLSGYKLSYVEEEIALIKAIMKRLKRVK